ncbi:MAG: hypothetical protein JW806_10415 [Sedimentisphaerales bacterium]|nr:hypothetical protein [Sedimentisphaerales bacterium]
MAKKSNALRTVLLVIVILIVAVIVLVKMFGGSALKAGVETAASKTLKVGVKIDDIDFSILGGKVGIAGLVIDNPPGYQHETLLKLGQGQVAVTLGSLLKDTVNIKEIMFDGIEVVIEQKDVRSNNLQDVINNLPKSDAKPEETTEKSGKPGKKLHIDKLEIKNVTVKAKLLPVPGKADTVTLKLNPIVMNDLGGDNKMDVAKLTGKIFAAIAGGIAAQGAGLLPKDMTAAMGKGLDQAAELGKSVAEEGTKAVEEGAEAGKEMLKGVEGLFKK